MKWFLILFLVFPFFLVAQNNILSVNGLYHLDIWKPYLKQVSDFQDSTNGIESSTYRLKLNTEVKINNKFWLSLGLVYKRIDYRVIDRIYTWTYYYYHMGQGNSYTDTVKGFYTDPADLVANAHNFGIHLEGNYELTKNDKWSSSFGLASDVYLLEMYRSYYESDDFWTLGNGASGHPVTTLGDFNQFRLSGVNLDLHYRIRWQFASRFNAGLKLSVGANLYSNWTHFSRNAWIGVGAEFGFNRKP